MTEEAFTRLRRARFEKPGAIAAAWAERRRRDLASESGRLLIVAADHPARGALGAGTAPMAMADRYDLLRRLLLALSRPGVDGVLGTPDILDDLALLGALDGRIAVGSMNRGGLRGAVFEMDDRFTGHDVASMVTARLDAAKLLVRMNYQDHHTARTLEQAAHAVTAAAGARLPIMIEPFLTTGVNHRAVNDLSTDAVITSVAIASGLGASSAYTWLKLPLVPGMHRVMEATTLPTFLLGGEDSADPAELEKALDLPGVRGLVAGRTLLYPPDDDVRQAVDLAAALVHGSMSPRYHA